jgi:hypothetical protein
MINPLIHYELDMARREQGQLCRRAALWHMAQHTDTANHRPPRRQWLRIRLSAATLVSWINVWASPVLLLHARRIAERLR